MDRAVPQRPTARTPGWTYPVAFTHPLTDATLVPPGAALPPLRRPPAPAPTGPLGPLGPAAPTPPPADFDLAKELRADRARIAAVLDQLRAAAADLQARQAGDMDQLQQVAVTLALNIAARVFHREVLAGEFPVEQIARELVAQLGNDEPPLRVRLHPDDLALVTARLDGQWLLPTAEPKLAADPTLARGTVAVDAATQTLRADPVRTLDEIRDELLRGIAHARS